MSIQLVSSSIRRSNRNRLLLSVGGIAIVLAIGAFNLRYLSNFFAGPLPISNVDLEALEKPQQLDRYWVDVNGDDVYETGMQMVETGRYGNETISANYQALLIGDHLLLVAASEETATTSYSGALVPIEADIQRDVVDYLEADADIEDAFLPYMLDAGNFRLAGYIGLGIGALMLAASGYGLFSALRYGDVAKHPVSKRLARHGDVPVVVSEIENELVVPRWSHGKLHTTANWLVYAPGADFHAMRLSEVAWLYKHVTQRRTYGIPVGKTFAAHIFDSHGQKIEVSAKNEQGVNAILEGVVQAAPWALSGYDKEIEKTWNKDRAAVVNAVNQRRQEAMLNEV